MSRAIKLLLVCATLFLISLQPAVAAQNSVSGTIVETMDSGGYTYVSVDNGEQKTWAAIPATKIEVGTKVTVNPGMVMNNFTSKSLNRNFESIIFSQGITKQ
jgi:hypothetical protein